MPVLQAPGFLPLLGSTLGLFRHARRGLDEPAALPRVERTLGGATLDPGWLRAYRDCVGLPSDGALPPLALQLAAAPLHMAILGDSRFPFRALGLVHLSQQVRQTRSLPADASFDLRAFSTDARWEKRGMSFGLVTEALWDGEVVWRGETRALAPGKTRLAVAPAAPGGEGGEGPGDAAWTCEHRLQVPEPTGRRYAGIAGDLNPIHQHALLARLFGFRRAIVHGTWTLARALALTGQPATEAFDLEARFRRPVELPSEVWVRARAGEAPGAHRVQVASVDGRTVYLSIRVEPLGDEETPA